MDKLENSCVDHPLGDAMSAAKRSRNGWGTRGIRMDN